jgi:predicted DNA-binding transcriptional regulator YafY
MTTTHVQMLVNLAKANRCGELYYRKGATRETIRPRIVEPYAFVQGKQDLMVHCYQLLPEEGWRYFMAHKIDRVADGGEPFTPRRSISMPTGEVDEVYRPDPLWSEGRRSYRDLVGDALADGSMDAEEREEVERVIRVYSLTMDDIRFVHASLYHRCLGAVIEDGFVTDVEIEQIRFLHRTLWQIGWCVGD